MSTQESTNPGISYAKVASSAVQSQPLPAVEAEIPDQAKMLESNEAQKTPEHLQHESKGTDDIQSETIAVGDLTTLSVPADANITGEGQAVCQDLTAVVATPPQEVPKMPPPFMHGAWLPFHPHPAPASFNMNDLALSQDPDTKDLPTDRHVVQYVYNIGVMVRQCTVIVSALDAIQLSAFYCSILDHIVITGIN